MDFYGADDPKNMPHHVLARWLEAAQKAGDIETEAVALATVDPEGLPNIRIVYAREITQNGIVFYTNYESQKGLELQSGKAALNYFFPKFHRQIRVRGCVKPVSAAQSDAYFATRDPKSRLGAWISKQSRPLKTREIMLSAWSALDQGIAKKRPPYWGGYILEPVEWEFWVGQKYRLHDRFRWRLGQEHAKWEIERLYP